MKKFLLSLTSVVASLLTTSCFQNETTIHLNKDGSGKIVEETRFGAQMLGMIDQMAALGGGAGGGADPLKEMFSEDMAKQRAASLGEGVTFEKSEAVDGAGGKGSRVTYQFKDINSLRISTEDSMKQVSSFSPMGAAQAAAAPKSEPLKFAYADGKLTINMPEPKANPAAAEGAGEVSDLENPQAQEMMKQMFADMKMSLRLVVEPGIAETNATHKQDKTITLMEMDMGKLMENADNMKKLSKVDQKNPAAAMDALRNVPGVKFESQKEVTVTVK